MQLLSCHAGKLLKVDSDDLGAATPERSFATGLDALDRLLPNGAFARGAIHEVLWAAKNPRPLFFAALVAGACASGTDPKRSGHFSDRVAPKTQRIVWCDPRRELYPPALA